MVIGAGLAFPSMFVANSEKYWIFYPWDYPIVSSMNYVFDMGGKNVNHADHLDLDFSFICIHRVCSFSNKRYTMNLP